MAMRYEAYRCDAEDSRFWREQAATVWGRRAGCGGRWLVITAVKAGGREPSPVDRPAATIEEAVSRAAWRGCRCFAVKLKGDGMPDMRANVWEVRPVAGAGDRVREWYLAAYPDDDAGSGIWSGLTFDDAMRAVPRGGGFYDELGVADSLVRERVFSELARVYDINYCDVHDAWLGGTW